VSVVALGAVRSCGVTTLALALAATWPSSRRVLLAELDLAGGTLAAASGWPPEPGLVSLAAAARRGQ
jgi:Flp pilus assembly CpaE family ATPase